MKNTEPCNVCGCTETNLVDGFYYCTECGTQDANVRETIIEDVFLGDGVTAITSKRRITQIPKPKETEMTDDWYKWHCMNFLLRGLADELIENGAAPSFKTKLLWVWTRYMKKYQNKADFGLEMNEDIDENDEDKPTMEENAFDSDFDNTQRKHGLKYTITNDIARVSMGLVKAFLYVALNLDKSPIQLTHLIRLMREGRVSILQWQKLVPKELRPRKLRNCLFFNTICFRYSYDHVRILSLELFRCLDLGNPIVPDLRPLIDFYMQELCLPNDLKPLVISLMHYRSFDYLDVNVMYPDIKRMPSYEIYVMSHILMALKICFSLDCDYEIKLSDAVDKINDIEGHPKSYNSEPTKRLFSFREWHNYIQFRKTILRTYTLHLGAPNYFDMNDYVAFEHQTEKLDHKIELNDEIAMNIIKKIPAGELNVIPRSEFVATMTPHCSYTRVIIEHQQDPEIKLLLEEDFTQYSLKYIMKDMFLVDVDSINPQNIIGDINEQNMQEFHKTFDVVDPTVKYSKKMVYVKDCDNHNWLVTKRPKLEHVTESKNDTTDRENDHGYESNSETSQNINSSKAMNLDITQERVRIQNESSPVTIDSDKIQNDVDSITNQMDIDIESEELGEKSAIINSSCIMIDSENKMYKNTDKDIDVLNIQEEVEGKSIFDDDFVDFVVKKEEPMPIDDIAESSPFNKDFSIIETYNYLTQTEDYRKGRDSDSSSDDSIRLNPETMDRNKVIKELVNHACKKYKVSVPGQYRYVLPKSIRRKRTQRNNDGCVKREPRKKQILDLISAYHSHLQRDVLYQMSKMVKSAVADFSTDKVETGIPMETEDTTPDFNVTEDGPCPQTEIDIGDETIEIEPNDTTQGPDKLDATAENDEYNLFSESSDGETHAEELLPKKNPEYDEKTHDIGQLYIKPTENPGAPEMELDPNLFKVIDQKIEEEKNLPDLAPDSTEAMEGKSDSEEDVCLSILQEQILQRKQLSDQSKFKLRKHLLPNKLVPPYKYWMRHYRPNLTALANLNQRFADELDSKLPKSFVFVLKECADVLGYPPFNLYKGLQRVEQCLKDKYIYRKLFQKEYFKRNKRINRRFREF